MYLYLLVARFHNTIADGHAAVELLKSEFSAKSRGLAPLQMGLLYATENPIPNEFWETLGIVEYN